MRFWLEVVTFTKEKYFYVEDKLDPVSIAKSDRSKTEYNVAQGQKYTGDEGRRVEIFCMAPILLISPIIHWLLNKIVKQKLTN